MSMDRALGVAGVAAALPGLLQVCRNVTLLDDDESTSLLLARAQRATFKGSSLVQCQWGAVLLIYY